ncbi:hypothetical protein GCM10017600_20990 [Streptosporangium carneum]|uniref:Uncharacterized protein n=1 Tax=Streptosporangium carneum TaxID=47481 RepID=A0A9W6MBT6_9ACTN|nr:hypothetical protein GCM10017600_20990 [Streptosporangium carneum]
MHQDQSRRCEIKVEGAHLFGTAQTLGNHLTVLILLGVGYLAAESLVRDWRKGWRPWRKDTW